MKCKFCPSQEELKWPENYKKGDKPINAQSNKPHNCIETPKKTMSFIKYKCPNCSTTVHGRNPKELCSNCIEHHELGDK